MSIHYICCGSQRFLLLIKTRRSLNGLILLLFQQSKKAFFVGRTTTVGGSTGCCSSLGRRRKDGRSTASSSSNLMKENMFERIALIFACIRVCRSGCLQDPMPKPTSLTLESPSLAQQSFPQVLQSFCCIPQLIQPKCSL